MDMFNGMSWTPRLDNYEPVELIINIGDGQGTITIPDQPKLRSAPLLSLITFTDAETPVSPKQGVPVIPYSVLQQGFITLYNEQYLLDGSSNGWKEGIARFPLVCLYPWAQPNNGYLWAQQYMKGQVIQWDKCYITFPVAQDFAAQAAIVLGVQYPSNDYQGAKSGGVPR